MTHRHAQWIEKLEVQVTTVAAALAAYFLIWPIVCPTDPAGPVVFVATGSLGKAALLAAAAWVLAAACCLPTVTTRPEGTMVAVLLGLGGLSLHSGPMRALLWVRQGDLGTMFWQMALEVLLLAALALAAAWVARVVRGGLSGLPGRWHWRDLLETLSEDEQRAYLQSAFPESRDGDAGTQGLIGGGFARIILEHLGMATSRATGRRTPDGQVLTRSGLCFLLCLVITAALVWLLARSAARGQLLFALAAGNFLGALVAYQLLPTRLSWAAWASPVVAALGFYVLAAVGAPRAAEAAQAAEGAWTHVEDCSQALPIDWITAGLGGAILGYWVSSRIHESRFLEHREEQEEGA